MKRDIRGQGSFVAPKSPKAQESELEEFAEYMIAQISRLYKSQVLNELQAGTVNKFSDAQTGNYANIFLKLAKDSAKKLVKRFDDDRIDALVNKVLTKTNKRNRDMIYAAVEKAIGLSSKELTATEGLTYNINALIAETAQWVKKLRDETLEFYTSNTLHAMTLGTSLADIMKQFDGMEEKRKNHAKFTARNQIGNFNSLTTKMRAQNLGIEEAEWISASDERVRDCHRKRNGKIFRLDKGLYSACDQKYLLPGVDYQCRCTYRLIVPED